MYTKKFQFTLVILLLLVGGMFMTPDADAQTVHALLVIMDADPSIGAAMKLDLGLLEKFLDYVDISTYPVRKTVYLSSMGRANSDDVLNWIRNVRPGSNDVVMVYYTGHGGMVSNTDRRTFLYLTDGNLYRSELANAVKNVSCRLKMLITDACSSAPSPPGGKTTSYGAQVVGRTHIKNLLGEHEGFLHINGATEGEYGWCSPSIGGSTFTLAFMEAISEQADDRMHNPTANGDGFVSWDEVYALAKKDTRAYYDELYPYFSDKTKDDLKKRGITSQNPQVYQMVSRRGPGGSGNRSDFLDSLWDLDNPSARFRVDVQPDKTRYRINDLLTFRMTVDQGCYITILNWDKDGTLAVLFPNKFSSDNYVSPGRIHAFPSQTDPFDIRLPGPVGTERFKVIAVSTRTANDTLQNVLGKAIPRGKQEVFGKVGDVVARNNAENSLLDQIRRINSGDWSVSTTSITLER